MSRALLFPIPDWPALTVACRLSSVNPGKNLSRDRCPTGSSSFLTNCVTVHSEDVVDTTDRLSRRSKFCLRVLTQLNSFVHGPNGICLGQELVRNELSGSNGNSECGASSG